MDMEVIRSPLAALGGYMHYASLFFLMTFKTVSQPGLH